MRKPDFLYIGAAKAGSTWIAEVLREHPQVYVPPVKDLQYFDHHFDKGQKWYLAHFKAAGRAKAAGELSHDYFLSAVYAERIYTLLPEVKLICCLREPRDRANSKYIYAQSTEDLGNLSCRDFLFRADIINEGRYLRNLAPFYQMFPRNNILVIFYDEIKEQPRAVVERLYRFLGIDESFQPPVLGKVVLGAQRARFPPVAHAAYRLAKLLRAMGLPSVVGVLKRNHLVNGFLYERLTERPGLSAAVRAEIFELFRLDYPELERLIGRPLPQVWFAPE